MKAKPTLVATTVNTKTAIEVRKITPPNLDDSYLGTKMVGVRPIRTGCPKLIVEKIGDQVVAHNYGHGGSGWTLAPGSAEYVNQLLLKSTYGIHLNYDSHITIIGAGVIGLFTAYDLIKKNFTNITIIAEQFDNLTSHTAGGRLGLSTMDNDPQMQLLIDKIGVETFKFYA